MWDVQQFHCDNDHGTRKGRCTSPRQQSYLHRLTDQDLICEVQQSGNPDSVSRWQPNPIAMINQYTTLHPQHSLQCKRDAERRHLRPHSLYLDEREMRFRFDRTSICNNFPNSPLKAWNLWMTNDVLFFIEISLYY